MLPRTTAAAMMLVISVSGCSQLAGVPSADPFPEATLRKAKSAEHWRVIANDVAAQTAGLKDRPELQGKQFYVASSSDQSDFSRAFQSMLISNLVNSGFNVATKPGGAMHVSYEAQVVRHRSGAGNYQPAEVAALSGGILVARQIGLDGAAKSAKAAEATALIAAAGAVSAKIKLHRATNTEVIITTSIVDNDRFLLRKTDVYYVEDAEGVMFDARPPSKVMG